MGLLMRERRELFGLKYIEETVEAYERVRAVRGRGGGPDDCEMAWAHGVLSTYLSVAGEHAILERARGKFGKISVTKAGGVDLLSPSAYGVRQTPAVAVDDLLELARKRKSVRWFLAKPVPREMIDRAVEVASHSPSACNRQPFCFRVFDDPDWVQRIAAIPFGTEGYAHNIPVLVVVVGDLGAFATERDRHLIYIDSSLAAMAFVHALEAQGLNSCCINWPDLEEKEKELRAVLGLSPEQRATMFIAVGYADPEGMVASSAKKPVEKLRTYN
jgi:nitroreductase